MRHDELLTEILLPGPRDSAGSAYASLEQPASGYAIVGVAAVVVSDAASAIERAGIGVTGVPTTPYRATDVEAALVGTDGSADDDRGRGRHVVGDATVNCDIHADREYRAAMAVVYTRRAIEAALGARWPSAAPDAARPEACGSSGSSPATPPAADLTGAVLARDLRVGGERWSKGRRLSAADLAALASPSRPMSASRRSRCSSWRPATSTRTRRRCGSPRRSRARAGTSRADRVPGRPHCRGRGVLHVRSREVERLDRIDPLEVFTALDGSVVRRASSSRR